MAIHCPECGFVNAEGANYCQKCGAYLGGPKDGDDEPTTMTYTVDDTGEMQPIDIDQVLEAGGAQGRGLGAAEVEGGGGAIGGQHRRGLLGLANASCQGGAAAFLDSFNS